MQYLGLDSTTGYSNGTYLDYTFGVNHDSNSTLGYNLNITCTTGPTDFSTVTDYPLLITGANPCSAEATTSFVWTGTYVPSTYNSTNQSGLYDSFVATGTHYYMWDPVMKVGDTI